MQHIVVVDDDPDIRELIFQTLTDEGYTVVQHSEGNQALVGMRTEMPALVLLDLMMPTLSGGEMLQLIRSDDTIAHVPVVLISASRELEGICIALGANACLAKPFDLDALIAIVQGLLTVVGISEDENHGSTEPQNRKTAEPGIAN